MILPTIADVRLILSTAASDAAITAMIADAALLVENCIGGMVDARATAIIKWVAAHLLSSRVGAEVSLSSSKLGDATDSYAAPELGKGLAGTTYGQQALALDPSGCLAGIGIAPVGFRVI